MENLIMEYAVNNPELLLYIVIAILSIIVVVDMFVIRIRDKYIKALKERIKLLEELSGHKNTSKPMNLNFGIRGKITNSYIGKDGEIIINGFELEGVDMLGYKLNDIPPDGGSGVKDLYRLCKPQLVQLDCMVTDCKFYKGAGVCSNQSPAITLNKDNTFVCWTQDME